MCIAIAGFRLQIAVHVAIVGAFCNISYKTLIHYAFICEGAERNEQKAGRKKRVVNMSWPGHKTCYPSCSTTGSMYRTRATKSLCFYEHLRVYAMTASYFELLLPCIGTDSGSISVLSRFNNTILFISDFVSRTSLPVIYIGPTQAWVGVGRVRELPWSYSVFAS